MTLADEVGYAILVVTENLSPAERTAFVPRHADPIEARWRRMIPAA